jgi:hypothetical protein
MSESKPFDDELLSAYLDEELAPEERARVEAYLAANPAARQLLEELRTVSSAVKRLPQESLPADMRETVLRRAERAMLTNSAAPSGEPASAGGASGLLDVLRKIPVGRSRRAWVWAGTAIAAGLLIMIFDRGPDDNAELPNELAQRDMAAVRKPLPPLEMRAVNDSQPEPATVALSRDRSSSVASAPAGAVATDQFAGGERGVSLGAVDGSGSAETPAAPRDEVDLLVVHVNARPDAIEQKLIDGVLARNGIVIEKSVEKFATRERTAAVPQSGFSSSVASAPAGGERMLREELSHGNDEPQEQPVDVVLVEAEPSQIVACLSELDADRANYLGIAVDDQMSESNRSFAKSAYNWKQHDRGVVPTQQKVQVADGNNYFETAGRQFGLEFRGAESVAEESSVRSGERFQLGRSAQSQSESEAVADFGYARRGKQKLAAKADTLQVLFVLTCPTEHAAPAAAPATTSPPPADSVP